MTIVGAHSCLYTRNNVCASKLSCSCVGVNHKRMCGRSSLVSNSEARQMSGQPSCAQCTEGHFRNHANPGPAPCNVPRSQSSMLLTFFARSLTHQMTTQVSLLCEETYPILYHDVGFSSMRPEGNNASWPHRINSNGQVCGSRVQLYMADPPLRPAQGPLTSTRLWNQCHDAMKHDRNTLVVETNGTMP